MQLRSISAGLFVGLWVLSILAIESMSCSSGFSLFPPGTKRAGLATSNEGIRWPSLGWRGQSCLQRGSGENVLQLRPTGVSLPQSGGHNENSE